MKKRKLQFKSGQKVTDTLKSASTPAISLPNRSRRLVFSLLALIVVPALALMCIEFALRLAGIGYPTSFFVPLKRDGHQILVENQKFGWRFFPRSAARTPRPTAIEPHKPSGSLRIFVFGESAAYGDPEPTYGFPRILEVLLQERYPDRRVEVINAAMTAINSHAILPIARDCSQLEGDFWLVYMGNNEVVGPYGAGTVFGNQTPPLSLIRATIALKQFRIAQAIEMLRSSVSSGKGSKTWGGMEMFLDNQVRQDDPRMNRVYAHFERNLKDIIETGTRAGARVIVSSVASNLKDSAPFASLHRRDLSQADLDQWMGFYTNGITAEAKRDFTTALGFYTNALHLDDTHADLQFRVGRIHEAMEQFPEALDHFGRARDLDVLRFRADSRINQIICETVKGLSSSNVLLLDFADLLARQSPHRLPGSNHLLEHVHFNFNGNYLLARSYAALIDAQLNPRPVHQPPEWLSVDQCAEQLALTDVNRYEIADLMRERLQLPPFTLQLDHTNAMARLQNELTLRKPALSREGLQAACLKTAHAFTRRTNDPVLMDKHAKMLKNTGDLAGALAQWRHLQAILPHYCDVYYQIGSVLDEMQQSREAIPYLETAVALRPNSAEAWNALGLATGNDKQIERACECFKRALEINPDFPGAHVNWGAILAQAGRVEEAKQHYQSALKLKPDYMAAYHNLGRLLNSEGKISEAISNYTAGLAQNPQDPVAHFNLGNALATAGQVAQALDHFAQAVRLNPSFAGARTRYGYELARQGQDSQAMEQFQEAVKVDPNNAEAHFNLGVAYAKQQNYGQAVEHFQEVLRIDPNYSSARKYLDAARTRMRQKP